MCGIVGYMGKRDAYPVLIKGLKRLEYQGYDSAGVALIDKKRRLNVYKTKGKVSYLKTFVSSKDVSGTIGIAHIRGAIHGEPCQADAHSHFSSFENLALIHNGIIENYVALKEKLQKNRVVFKSSTDTEVLVQSIEFFQISTYLDLLTIVRLALHEVIGAYVVAVPAKNNPDEVIAACKSTSWIVGIGKGAAFWASDATPIVEYAAPLVCLPEGKTAVIHRNKVITKPTVDCRNLPETLECPEPLIAVIPLLLFASHVAIYKGESGRLSRKSGEVGNSEMRKRVCLWFAKTVKTVFESCPYCLQKV